MKKLLSIYRGSEIIHECINPWYVPRIGETIALAKWDTTYTVVKIFTVFGNENNVETVRILVEKNG